MAGESMVTSSDARLPLYQQLRDQLTSKIVGLEWRPDEAIPAEAELALEYGVSVGTVRKTIEALVNEGLLERFQGKGTFVRRPGFESSLLRSFRPRGPSGERLVPQSRILKREVGEPPPAMASVLKLPRGAEIIHLSRLRLFDGHPTLTESIWLPRERFEPLVELPTSDFGDLWYPLYERLCGQSIASAEESLTAEAVSATQARLLRLEPGAPVIVIERLALGYDRHPLEWRRSRGPADRFHYQIEVR